MYLSRRVKKFFIIPLIILPLIFIMAEVYIRYFSFLSPLFIVNRIQTDNCRPDPQLGWGNKTGVYTVLPSPSWNNPIKVTIENDGGRATASCDAHTDDRDKIVLAGCSWMFGLGLSDRQTMGWKL